MKNRINWFKPFKLALLAFNTMSLIYALVYFFNKDIGMTMLFSAALGANIPVFVYIFFGE